MQPLSGAASSFAVAEANSYRRERDGSCKHRVAAVAAGLRTTMLDTHLLASVATQLLTGDHVNVNGNHIRVRRTSSRSPSSAWR